MPKGHNITSGGAQQLGFGKGGVVSGSSAAHAMASGKGHVPTAVSGLQSAGAGGNVSRAEARVSAGAHQIGFGKGGVVGRAPAAHMMATGKGNVPPAVSAMQSMGARGAAQQK